MLRLQPRRSGPVRKAGKHHHQAFAANPCQPPRHLVAAPGRPRRPRRPRAAPTSNCLRPSLARAPPWRSSHCRPMSRRRPCRPRRLCRRPRGGRGPACAGSPESGRWTSTMYVPAASLRPLLWCRRMRGPPRRLLETPERTACSSEGQRCAAATIAWRTVERPRPTEARRPEHHPPASRADAGRSAPTLPPSPRPPSPRPRPRRPSSSRCGPARTSASPACRPVSAPPRQQPPPAPGHLCLCSSRRPAWASRARCWPPRPRCSSRNATCLPPSCSGRSRSPARRPSRNGPCRPWMPVLVGTPRQARSPAPPCS
mmetsp:Transcript_26261/g.67126  ORF Transcript_26261/g.67126 Transcript_26261/m.67126 type:complete len:313 (+) Transcript_26261:349-1287(+)